MREQALNDVVARKFLLGQLSPEEQGRIEELAFDDSDTFTFLESVEEDLIDDFIQGELSPDEKQRFKDHFLSLPGRRGNLKIGRVLHRHFDETEVEKEIVDDIKTGVFGWFNLQPSWLRLSITAAALALVLIAVWLFLRGRAAQQPEPIQAGPGQPVGIPSPALKVSPSPEPTQPPVHAEKKPKPSSQQRQTKKSAYALLMPGSVRGEGPQQLRLPDSPNVPIEMLLATRSSYRTYEAVLESEGGTILQRWPNLKAKQLRTGQKLIIDVPVALLEPQRFYRVVVNGVSRDGKATEIDHYPFEAIK